MSTDPHNTAHGDGNSPVHRDVSFETRDIRVGAVVKALIYLAVVLALSLALCVYILRYATALAVKDDTPPVPLRHLQGPTMPPEPRLQGVRGHDVDPQQDLRNKIDSDTKENEKVQWIDEKSGIAQIPVKEAMKIIAEKGLPAANGAPAAK